MHLPDAPPPAKPWDPPPGDEGKLPADELRHDLQRFQAPAAAAAAAAAATPAPEDDDDDGEDGKKRDDDGEDDGDGKKRDGDGEDDGDDDGDATGPRREARRAQAVVDAAGGVAAASTEAPPIAQHCSSRHGGVEEACRGPTVPNLKQRRNARLLAGLLDVAAPDVDAMSHDEAERWLHDAWRRWMARK